MERDFMGIRGKYSDGLAEEESSGNQKDSEHTAFGGSAVRWPFSSKISALQQLMSFKNVHEEKSKKATFDHRASSGFQPVAAKNSFEPGHRAFSLKEAPQRCFSLGRHGAQQSSMNACRPQSMDNLGASNHQMASHPSIPISMGIPFAEVHGSSNAHGHQVASLNQQSFGRFTSRNPPFTGSSSRSVITRNVSRPTTSSQLTIFYAGSVNVYDDVPLEKAQEIMFSVSKSCNATSNAPNQRPESHVSSPLPKVAVHNIAQRETQIPSHVSSPGSVTSLFRVQSGSCSSPIDDVAGVKNVSAPSTCLSMKEPSKANNTSALFLPRAVPQARKASIARFLEKRKERVTNAMPYSSAKTSPENSAGVDGTNVSSKRSSSSLSLSSNREDSWCSVQLKNDTEGRDSPSTKLEM